jgi:hypothetical protein
MVRNLGIFLQVLLNCPKDAVTVTDDTSTNQSKEITALQWYLGNVKWLHVTTATSSITFKDGHFKAQIYELIKQHKPQY